MRLDAAVDYDRRQRLLAATAVRTSRNLWTQLLGDDFDRSWQRLGPRLLALLVAAQNASATESLRYVTRALAEQDLDTTPAARPRPRSLVGVASDGRPLQSLLYEPVIRTKQRFGEGAAMPEAKASGLRLLDSIMVTQIHEIGWGATSLGMVSRPRATGFVRMVSGSCCARCAVLAGRWYRWDAGFDRHTGCACVGIPASEDTGRDLRTDPRGLFEAGRITSGLNRAEIQAVKDGADLAQVVNAHRGMYVAGQRKFTYEGRTLRRSPRLMPSQIYADATSRDDALRLLRDHGYIT